jgi:hypothetical protein
VTRKVMTDPAVQKQIGKQARLCSPAPGELRNFVDAESGAHKGAYGIAPTLAP